MQSGRSLGGAQPKLLVTINGEEWMAKLFPAVATLIQPLIEHASMILAAERSGSLPTITARTTRLSGTIASSLPSMVERASEMLIEDK